VTPGHDKLIIGCGYLGRRVAALWRAQGQQVWATTRGRAADLRAAGIEAIVCDVLNPNSLHVLPAVATVLYCVGLDRSASATMREVFVEGLANVLDHLPAPQRFLYISSTSVYGQTTGEEVDERAPTEPEEDSGRVVLEAERLLRRRLPRTVILRFAGIYGPGRLLRRRAIEKGEPIQADPERWINLIHVEDGAAAILAAEQFAQLGDTINVCDGQPVRRRDFFTKLAHLLGAPEPCFLVPDLGLPPPPHEKANRRIGNRKLREELHFAIRYPSWREGLAKAILRPTDGNE
jgi:nucleoside-diphosphate-sugar epimerase